MKTVFRTLLPILLKYKLKGALILLFSILAGGLKSLIPPMLKLLTDSWVSENKKVMFILPLCLFLVWVFNSFFRYFQTFWLKIIAINTVSELRCRLMDKYLRSNLYLLNRFSSTKGGLMSRLVSDLENLYVGVISLCEVLREPVFIIGVFFYIIFYLNAHLGFFFILVLVLTFWISKKIAKSVKRHGHKNQEIMEGLISHLKENLDGIRIIQAFNLQSESREKFLKQMNRFLKTKKEVILRETAISPIFNSLTFFFVTGLIYYVNFLILQKKLTVAEITSFAAALFMLIGSLRTFQHAYIQLQQSVVSLERFENLMKTPLEMMQKTPNKSFPKDWKEIEVKSVSFSYNKKEVLHNINFKVKRNQLVAIVGESGSGKSTLINLLARFFDPQKGALLIDQISFPYFSLNELRENIAFVSQEIFLFQDSIEKNIFMGRTKNKKLSLKPLIETSSQKEADPLLPYRDQIKLASKKAGAHEFIEALNQSYQTQVGEEGSHLSGGEKQRISIARAFFKDANILLLDEPTSALDSKNEQIIQKSLYELVKNRTTFITTHRMSMTEKAQKILVLKNGFLVEEGSHEELLRRKGEYVRLRKN